MQTQVITVKRLVVACTRGVILLLMSSPGLTAGAANNELKILIPNKPLHFNSSLISGTYTGIPAAQLFSPLLTTSRNWELSPYLAESWNTSDDGLSITFKLRPDAVFHDGEPIESNDVAFSILTVRDYHPFSSMLDSVESVETPDPLTAVVKLKYASLVVPLVAASPMLPIIPEHVYGNGEDIRTHPANHEVVGSGPFQLVNHDDTGIVMEKFQDFFIPERPFLERLEFIYTADKTMNLSFESEAVHLQGFVSDVVIANKLELLPNYTVDFDGYAGVGPIRIVIFNLRHPPLDNVLVRRALAYAIDNEFIIKEVFQNRVLDAHTAIHPDNPFYDGDVESYSVNFEKANELLDQAGYPRNAEGTRFTLNIDTGSDPAGGYYLATTEYLKREMYGKLGIQLNIIYNRNFKDYAKRMSEFEFDIGFVNYFNWGDPVIGVDRIFRSDNIRKGVMFSNLSGYINADVDKWINQARSAIAPEERKRLYSLIQQQIAQDIPVYPTTTLAFSTIYHSRLKGMDNSIWGTMFPFDSVHWD